MRELYLLLRGNSAAYQTLEELRAEGFNATVLSAEGLRHAIEYYPEDHHFFTLRHYEKKEEVEMMVCLFIVKDDQLEKIKDTIRRYTNNFKDIKGAMY
ncbi:MAG: hypothetical protein II467_06510, partial [Bacilli bacterium]|nr:hypothetical protein [Bacilli bacterium]